MSDSKIARWQGRNRQKDALRNQVWAELEDSGAAIGDPWSKIPDFVGAKQAADQLAQLPQWQSARVVKCNPDRGQAWVRLKALQQGKRVYAPVPELVKDFPFVLLDPVRLNLEGIAFEEVMYSEGFVELGQRLQFEDMQPMDICVVGCVAVTRAGGRTGKGAGFADLEMGIFRELGILPPSTPVVTSVHDVQVVEDHLIVMEAHDTPLDFIATPTQLIKTQAHYPVPTRMDWDAIQPDQYEKIPFLRELRQKISG